MRGPVLFGQGRRLLLANVYNSGILSLEKLVRQRLIILFALISLALSACGGGEAAGTSTPLPTDTPLVPPTLAPTAASPLAILVLPVDLDPDTSNLYQ